MKYSEYKALSDEEKAKRNGNKKYKEWNEKFEALKAEDTPLALPLVNDTDDTYLLCRVAEHLEEVAKLVTSEDPTEHWNGFLAKTNFTICLQKIGYHNNMEKGEQK